MAISEHSFGAHLPGLAISLNEHIMLGVYTATCISSRTNRGLFEIRGPNKGIIDNANVGTPFVSDDILLTIADGSTDFAVGNAFTITVTAGSYSGYDFAADIAAAESGTPIVQVASGVISAAVDTKGPPVAKEQFAVVRGPSILPATFVGLGWDGIELNENAALHDAALSRSIEQLARRGIVLR
jgi:hypothetical protein